MKTYMKYGNQLHGSTLTVHKHSSVTTAMSHYTKAYDTSESLLWKSLVQVSSARKFAQVTCESAIWHKCKFNNGSCML